MVGTGNGDDPSSLYFPGRAVDKDVVDGGAEQSRARTAGIQIEEIIREAKPTLIFVEHDRRFVENVVNKIIQL